MEWLPPPSGHYKLNFNGSSMGNPGPSGYGEVIKDHLGKVIRIFTNSIDHGDSIMAKVMGLIMGLQEFKKIGVDNISVVEGDSRVVNGWGKNSSQGVWKLTLFKRSDN